jgi:hypothetical protein
MYYITFNEEKQSIEIQDQDGNILIQERAYATKTPYPGRKWTFEQSINLLQWQLLFDLVANANKGRRIK